MHIDAAPGYRHAPARAVALHFGALAARARCV